MSEEQQFCLRWNNFQANITSQFEALRDEEDFVDVTLACDGQRLKAHKVVLSACSPYFKELFKSNPCKHPILFLRDVAFHHLRALVEFMYAGEVNVAQAQLSAFLRTAESLQIRGLTEAPQRHKQAYIRQHHQQSHHPQPQQQTNVPSEVVTGIGLDSSSAAEEIASSPECVGIDEDEDGLSMSPGGGSSPNPAKRQCLQQDGDITHQRAQTSTSSSHSDLRQELEVSSKDNPTELVEPKLELPDYSSDGESKTGTAAFLGLDSNSVDVNASFAAALHGGGMDILPGPSGQSFLGEPSGNLDSGQVDHRKLHSLDPRPCPICNRMYSNLSNLRQHVRLIHNPQTVACPLCSKPFKTKLYLKRHLMSFHEILCGNNGQGGSKQGAEFYPPPPQVFLGPPPVSEEEEGKKNSESLSKGKDQQNPLEIFHIPRGNVLHHSLPQTMHEDKSGSKAKDISELYHHRNFMGSFHHEDKMNYQNSIKTKHNSPNMDMFHMPRIFQSIITHASTHGNEDRSNFLPSANASQHSKTKEGQLSIRNFQNEEEKGSFHTKNKEIQQGQNSDFFQSPRGFPSASQSTCEEKTGNFQSQSSAHGKSKDLSHSDMYHTNRSFSNSEEKNIYTGTSEEKDVYTTQNHKEEQGLLGPSQVRNQDNTVSSDFRSSVNQENSSCASFMGALSLSSNENTRLALMNQSLQGSSGEGLHFLNQQSNGKQDTSFLSEPFTQTKHAQPESEMETESINHEQNT
ncbi:uncharacterized protein [Periplaneta americana]|uniref:uncharacterized protein isoform X2 n=1 Tax=Periplaneta americana TaxID=6978 RepID=UPI0037E70F4B